MKNYDLEKFSVERHLVWNVLRDTDTYYLNHHIVHIDFSSLEEIRKNFKSFRGTKLTYVGLVLYSISRVLQKHKQFNSYFRTFPIPKIAKYKGIDLSFTMEKENIDGEKKLLLSILKNADNMDFKTFINEFEDFKSKKLEELPYVKNMKFFKLIPNFLRMTLFRLFCKPFPGIMREISGTCAFTSVGKYGVDFTTPLSPKSITFSLGKVDTRPMVIKNDLKAVKTAYITLTYDHRIADGRECASLASDLKYFLENELKDHIK